MDKIWTDIWAGGTTNPLAVMEQLTYLMFILLLDEKVQKEFDNLAGETGFRIFPQSEAGQSMRWSRFRERDARDIFAVLSQRVFPAMKQMRGVCSSGFH